MYFWEKCRSDDKTVWRVFLACETSPQVAKTEILETLPTNHLTKTSFVTIPQQRRDFTGAAAVFRKVC